MNDAKPAPIINIADVELHPRPPAFAASGDAAQRFDARMGLVGARIGAKLLGYNITSVPPGKRAFPLHNHMVNEEMFFVLEGSGELRLGDATHAVRAGDIIACPPGGPETAHQLVKSLSRPNAARLLPGLPKHLSRCQSRRSLKHRSISCKRQIRTSLLMR